MLSSLPESQKERGFPFTPSRKKKLLKFKRESTRFYKRRAGTGHSLFGRRDQPRNARGQYPRDDRGGHRIQLAIDFACPFCSGRVLKKPRRATSRFAVSLIAACSRPKVR